MNFFQFFGRELVFASFEDFDLVVDVLAFFEKPYNSLSAGSIEPEGSEFGIWRMVYFNGQ